MLVFISILVAKIVFCLWVIAVFESFNFFEGKVNIKFGLIWRLCVLVSIYQIQNNYYTCLKPHNTISECLASLALPVLLKLKPVSI